MREGRAAEDKGKLTYWYVGPNEASPPLDTDQDDQFWAAFGKTYPNITVEQVSLDYNQSSTSCALPRSATRRRLSRGSC